MYRRDDTSTRFGPHRHIRPRSQAALLGSGEDEAPVVVRVTRQLLDAVRSLAA
jgi:hypothetical protein